MEKHPGIINGGVIRKDGTTTPANAGDVLAIVVERFDEAQITLLSRFKAIAGKQIKEALDDGVDAETLVVAAGIAFKRCEPQSLLWIAQDLLMARGGMRMTRREYEKALQDEIEIGGRS
jgi:hypothetical protein